MDEILVLKHLGQGAYGNVKLIEDAKTKIKYVLKEVDLSRTSAKERVSAEMEVKILSTLRHPNIVQYKWSYQTTEGALHIIMSYCDGGDLHSLIRLRRNKFFEENQILDWFVQITMAVEYIHDRHILHRDLKTPNIFLTKTNVIKVGDFGISRILDKSGDYATTLIGTPFYMSPEIFMNKPYNYKSDVWALGCCLYELCALKHPFKAQDIQSLAKQVLIHKPETLSQPYSLEIHKVLKACLHKVAEKRPSARKILRHPFIRKHIVNYLKSSMQHLKERNDDLTQRRKSVTKDNLTETKNDGVTLRRKSVTKDTGPELVTGLLPPVTGSKIRSTSVSRKRKKPRLQLVKDRSMENKDDQNIKLENEFEAEVEVEVEQLLPNNETVMATASGRSNGQLDNSLLCVTRSSSAPGLHRIREAGRIIVSAGHMRVNTQQSGSDLSEISDNNDDVELLMSAMRQTLKLGDIEKDD